MGIFPGSRPGVDEKEAPDNTLFPNHIVPSSNMLIIRAKPNSTPLAPALLTPVIFPLDPKQLFLYTSASK